MGWFDALLLGLLQGLTEFLPVSSSGHLVVAQSWLGLHLHGVLVEVVLHVATLASVLVFYRQRIDALLRGVLAGEADAWRFVAKLALATLPAVILVMLAGDFLEAQFESERSAGIGFLITAGVLWRTRHLPVSTQHAEPAWHQAWWIGCAQAFAILPGVSRSGSTVAAGLALGLAPAAAAEFSFLMSVAAVLGACVRSFGELGDASFAVSGPLLFAAGVAFVSGIGAIGLLTRLLRSQRFYVFAPYLVLLGTAVLVHHALR